MSNHLSFDDMKQLSVAIARSGLFGINNSDQALSLMAIASAEGMHPAIAARDYHIIQGRPTLKADAMLARFLNAGGKINWHELNDKNVSATFTHPQGGEVTISWDMAMAEKAGLKKGNWDKYPRQMLRARVVSEGVRTVCPGVIVGTYTPEEAIEFEPAKNIAADADFKEIDIKKKIKKPEPPKVDASKPKAIEVEENTDPNGEIVRDWLEFGKEMVSYINASETSEALEEWVKLNSDSFVLMHKDSPKAYERLAKILTDKRNAFLNG